MLSGQRKLPRVVFRRFKTSAIFAMVRMRKSDKRSFATAVKRAGRRAGLVSAVLVLALQLDVLGGLLRPFTAQAAALTVASATSETQQTTTSTTFTASDTSIASGSLPSGTYFVAWGAAVANSNNANVSNARLVRGSTEIAALSYESMTATAANMGIARSGYWLGTLSGSEALTIQYSSTAGTTYIDSKFIKAIRLDTNLVADTDYFTSGSQESSADEVANVSTSGWTDIKTLAKTFHSTDTQDYLVFASMEISPDNVTNDCSARLEVDGTPGMTSNLEGEDITDQQGYAVAKVYSVDGGSKSIKLQGQSVGGATCDYRRSRIYVFRASVFDQVAEDYSAAETTLASSTWTDKNTKVYTPNQSETVMVIGSRALSTNNATCGVATRFDDGTTQYADAQALVANGASDYLIGMSAASLSVSAAKTFKVQFQRSTGSCTARIKESTLLVWSMTLRGAAAYNQSAYRWFDDSVTSSSAWWNGSWLNRRKITFSNSQSSENLVNFPVRVSLSSLNIDYSKTQNSGQDIRFVDANGSTLLKHEIETWNESGTSEVWVKVPQIDSGSNTDFIWMYYNNGSAGDGQDAANVWDGGYRGVWHSDESAGTTLSDSTVNTNSATKNSATNPNPASGQVNGAQTYNGSDSRGNAPINSSLNITGNLSISAWVNAAGLGTTIGCMEVDLGTASDGSGSITGLDTSASTFASQSITATGTWTVSNTQSAAHKLRFLNSTPVVPQSGSRSAVWGGVVNGSTADTSYFAILKTYTDNTCATPVDSVTVQFIYTAGQSVSLTVDPSLSFAVAGTSSSTACNGATSNVATTATTVPLGTPTTSTNRIGVQNLTVTTNAGSGYAVYARYTAKPVSGSNDIDDHTGSNASPAVFSAAGTEAYGYTTNDSTLGTGTPDRFTSSGGNKWAAFTTSNAEVAYSSASVSNQTTCLAHQVGIGGTTPAGSYTTTAIYTATPIY